MIAPAAETIVTAEGIAKALAVTKANVGLFIPSLIVEICQKPSILEICASQLELVLYCGGDVPEAVGNKMASKVRLSCLYGQSEIGITPQLISPNAGRYDWHYFTFHPCLGIKYRQITGELYEACMQKDIEKESTQTTFTINSLNFEGDEYRTKDLFSKHPTLPNTWRWRARADDIIVFLNGEKWNPNSMEQTVIAKNQEVSAALVVGTQKFQAALLVEPKNKEAELTTEDKSSLIEKIWPTIEEANKDAPAHAQIEKELILITSVTKPMIRAGKGTVQRAATVESYSAEIEQLYTDLDSRINSPLNKISVSMLSLEALAKIIRSSLVSILEAQEFSNEDNLFILGMDSLQSLQLTRKLRACLDLPELELSTIYSNPSVTQLAHTIKSLQDTKENGGSQTVDRHKSMVQVFDECCESIRRIPISSRLLSSKPPTSPRSVILTGTTGRLGSQILYALLKNSGVQEVFCLNRREDNLTQLANRIQIDEKDLTLQLVGRAHFLQADLSKPLLGLHPNTYENLRSKVDLIIHNAWPVNFNIPLASFHPHLAGLVNLFELSVSSENQASVLFVSSVSSIMGLSNAGPVPEQIISSFDAPHRNGYAESKFIGELLCNEATNYLKIHTSVARIGQIAGSVKQPGLWNPTEWVPSLIISSVHLNALPESLGPTLSNIDWLPIDFLAEAIVEVATKPQSTTDTYPVTVYHFSNPHPTSWISLLPAIMDATKSFGSTCLQSVSPSLWLSKVHKDLEDMMGDDQLRASALRRNPAAKLLDFYRISMLEANSSTRRMDCACTMEASEKFRSMLGVGPDWMTKWIAEWMAAGLLRGKEL
jgi:thioester reductase-like protein